MPLESPLETNSPFSHVRLSIRLAHPATDWPKLASIRRQVFHLEQQIPEALDFDGQDAEARHLLAEVEGEAVATLRWRILRSQSPEPTAPPTAKLERLAVLASHRRQGIALQLMEFALDQMHQQGVETVVVHAQRQIQPLYDRLQFHPQGEPFWEAGIEHVKMVRCI